MNKQIDNKENIVFIMILRIVAAFAVIMIHTKTLTNFDTKGYYFLHCCILWCVPLFFMITGYIFLGIKTYLTYKHVTKNIVKFFFALFTIGWFYAFIQRFFENGISVYTFVNSFIDVIKGNLWAHMWYVYSIIGIYLVLPVLSAFVSNNKKNLYILTLICGVFEIIFKDISTVFEIGFSFPLSGYCFYVLMGATLCVMEERTLKKLFVPSVLILILTLIGLAIGIFAFDINIKQSYSAIYVAVMSVAIFIIFKRLFNKAKVSLAIVSISKCTWGIYLVHPFFIHLFHKFFKVTIEGYNQFIAFPISCLVIFVISYSAVVILKKIPLIKKFI